MRRAIFSRTALGLAVLASIAAAHSQSLLAAGHDAIAAVNGGYQVAFAVGALFALLAAVLGGALLRADVRTEADTPAIAPH